MNRRSWVLGVLIGTAVGLIVALSMSYVDWRHNPQGIFHNELGTSWDVVFETAASWFIPVALVASALSIAVLSWLSRGKG